MTHNDPKHNHEDDNKIVFPRLKGEDTALVREEAEPIDIFSGDTGEAEQPGNNR